MAIYLLLAPHQVPGTTLSITAVGPAVGDKVAVRTLEAVRTWGRGINRCQLGLARWGQEPGPEKTDSCEGQQVPKSCPCQGSWHLLTY